LGDDPELALGMIDEGDGLAGGGCDGPTATEEINLVVVVYAATAVERQMEIEQAGVWTDLQDGALFALGFGGGVVGRQAGGAADSAVLAGQFGGQQILSVDITGNFLEGQQGDETFLEGAKTALNFSLGVGRELRPMRIKQNSFSRSPIRFTRGSASGLN